MASLFPELCHSSLNFNTLRERAGLTHEEVALRLGVTERTIYRWETGDSKPNKLAISILEKLVEDRLSKESNRDFEFKYIDLFAGIGGFRKAFDSIGGKCVLTSEIDKYARFTYQSNFPCDHAVIGDIKDYSVSCIPDFDVLLAGFPCQPFSIAGVSKKNSLKLPHGFKDATQGTLFFDIVRILETHRPSVFVLENVKNLYTHDKGKTFKVISNVLQEELGYNISYRIIDGKGYVPQHRERIFIVGTKENLGFNINDHLFRNPQEGPVLKYILHPEDGSENEELPYTVGECAKVNKKYTLSDKLWNYLQAYAKKHKSNGNGFGFGLVGPDDKARTLSARYYKDGSEILVNSGGDKPRRLTPRECARIMGYDRLGESEFRIPVSDNQAYRQFGNGVIVPVLEELAGHLKPYILKSIGKPAELKMHF